MTSKLLVIEERVPGPEGAIRLYVPGTGDGAEAARLPYRSRFVQGLADAIAASDRRPCLLVGPSRRVARQWIDTIARTGMPVFNVHVTTPRALCYDLAAEALAAGGLAVATPQAGVNLVEKVLREAIAGGRLQYFPHPPSFRRLAERMLVTLSAMRMAGIDSARVLAAKRFGRSPKAHDLACLLDAYEAQLKAENLADTAIVATMAREAADDGRVPFDWDTILIPKGLERKPLEDRVFSSLAKRVRELPIDDTPPSFADRAKAPALHFTRAIGEANEIRGALRRCIKEGIRLDQVELLHTDEATYPAIVQELLAVMQGGVSDDLPVTFAEGLSIRGATPARALAAWLDWRDAKHQQWQLASMLRDGLIAWRRFVPKPAIEPSADSPLQPSDAAAPGPATADPGAAVATDDVTRAGLIRQLRRLTLDLDKDRSAAAIRAAITSLEQAPLSTFVAHGRRDDDEPEFDEAVAQQIRSDRLKTLGVLADIIEGLFACEPPADANAGEVLHSAREFVEKVAASRSQFDNNAKNRFLAEFAERERWLQKHPDTPAQEIVEWLRSLLDSLVVMGSGPRPGCMHVASIITGGHSGRPVTFIVGLDEDRFPRAHGGDPVLPDHDRVQLSGALETSSHVAARSRTEYWNLLGRLRGDVWLSYSCRDLVEQSEVFPSPLLLEAYGRHRAVPAIKLEDFLDEVGTSTDAFITSDPACALTPSDRSLAQLGANPSMETVRRVMEHCGPGLAHGEMAAAARRSADFTAWDGLVPDAGPALDPSSPGGRPASAHSLEALGACPRRFFFRYGLGVEVLDTGEPDGDQWLDPLERGSAMHAVLERFMRRFLPDAENPPAGPLHPVFDRDESELDRILAEVLAETRAAKPTANEGEFQRQRRELSKALGMFLKAEERHCTATGARPVALEAAIGVTPKTNQTTLDHKDPVALQVAKDRHVQLRGYVDRVDHQHAPAAPLEYSIVDYKSGSSTRFKKGDANDPLAVFDSGRRLQHGLYVLMVRHVARHAVDPTSDVITFTYVFPSARGGGERLTWTAKELEGVTTIVDRLCGVVAAGAFIATNDKTDCAYCDYLDVCGKPLKTAAIANRKLADEKLKPLFAGLREVAAAASQPSPIDRPNPVDFATATEPALGDPEDAAARASIHTDLGTSFAVHASAGTGKTACLVDRMIALVQTGTATVRQIAAITFTKKAAAELSRRFREQLQGAAATTADESERERFLVAIAEIDSAVIGTVHAFCDRLLRERPIEAGLDPSFELLDAAAEESLLHRAWREFSEIAIHDPKLNPLRRDLETSGVEFQELWSAFRTLVTHADVKRWPTDDAEPPDVAQLVGDVCKEIAARLPAAPPPLAERGTDELMNALEATLRAYENRPNDDTATLLKVADSFAGRCKKITQKVWWPDADAKQKKAHAAALEDWWTRTQDRFREPLRQWQAYRYSLAIRLLLEARDHYDQVRTACGVLSFSDLLCRTAALLREKPDVRLAFAERYPFLLVDEFQDTDPLQAEIMLLLTADDPKAMDWRTAKVKPGSLFVVGDPQQSIYRFRRADIEVFEFVKGRIVKSGGRELFLTTNFRTNGPLVGWVNTQFSGRFAQWRKDHGGCVPEFKPSTPGRSTGSAGMLSGFRRLCIKWTDVSARSAISAEAEAVASFIRRAIDNRLTVPRTKKEVRRGIAPECRPEDFMIVTGDTGNLSTYANALHAVGLPCDVTGRKGPDSEDDLRTLRLCLMAITDPDDAVAALAVLRSPVFGFSDAELYAFRAAGGKIRGWLQVPPSLPAELRERYEAAAEALRRWIKMAGSLPLPAAVEAIADQAGLLLIASAADGQAGRRGRAGAGAIMTFIERLRIERHLLNSVRDVVARIDDLVCPQFPKQDFDTISLDDTAGGAVRVMNLHKVKGLESPVVFLCDTDGSGAVRAPSWHVSRTGAKPEGFLVVTRSLNAYGTARLDLAKPLDWDAHEARERSHLLAENLRKQYVAGTRPGCCLIASVFTKKDGTANGGWHDLAPDVTSFADLPELPPGPAIADGTGDLPDDAVIAAAMATAADAVRAIHLPTYGTVTPRDFLTEPAERLRHSGDGLGEAWGTVIHLLLESALRNEQSPQPAFDLTAIAVSALAETELAESAKDLAMLADRAVELIDEVRKSPLWKRIQAGGECYMEVPFSICVDAAEIAPDVPVDYGPAHNGFDPAANKEEQPTPPRPPVLIRGQIDLTFRDVLATPAETMTDWSIVDWKTSAVVAADQQKLVDSYRPQLTLYARCWAVREIPTPDLPE